MRRGVPRQHGLDVGESDLTPGRKSSKWGSRILYIYFALFTKSDIIISVYFTPKTC